MATLDFPNTCPLIDAGMLTAKENCDNVVESLLEEASGLLPAEVIREQVDDCVAAIHAEYSDQFESIRGLNSDMRTQAESQLEDLETERDDAKYHMERLEVELEIANDRIESLKEQLLEASDA
jgi:chromosome segregation ATPase